MESGMLAHECGRQGRIYGKQGARQAYLVLIAVGDMPLLFPRSRGYAFVARVRRAPVDEPADVHRLRREAGKGEVLQTGPRKDEGSFFLNTQTAPLTRSRLPHPDPWLTARTGTASPGVDT